MSVPWFTWDAPVEAEVLRERLRHPDPLVRAQWQGLVFWAPAGACVHAGDAALSRGMTQCDPNAAAVTREARGATIPRMKLSRLVVGGLLGTATVCCLLTPGCASESPASSSVVQADAGDAATVDAATTDTTEAEAVAQLRVTTKIQLDRVTTNAAMLLTLAPTEAWSTSDASRLEAMRASYIVLRDAYVQSEGLFAVLAPNLGPSIDRLYEQAIGDVRDEAPFDAQGFAGLHAIERILWAEMQRMSVEAAEEAILGYSRPEFPKSKDDADAFRQKMLTDAQTQLAQAIAAIIGATIDFTTGMKVVRVTAERQLAKVTVEAPGKDVSRYSDRTLADLRSNFAGARAIYGSLLAHLRTLPGGRALDDAIAARFTAIDARYAALPGDALPEMPATWTATNADDGSEFGKLYVFVRNECDANNRAGLIALLNEAEQLAIRSAAKP